MTTPFVSFVVPAYNEAHRIEDSLEKVRAYFAAQSYDWEVVVADDGSTDGTAERVARFAQSEPRVRVERLPHRGKGGAVREGMLRARGRYRVLSDADLAVSPEQVAGFLPPAVEGADLVIASREGPDARRIGEPWSRHVMGRVFNLWVRIVAVSGISDTQCGFKCFTDSAAERLFRRDSLDGWAFDVETLFLARRLGLRVVEVPVTWVYGQGSKVRPFHDAIEMFLDVSKVRWKCLRGEYREFLRSRAVG
jgi:glycosyltransferase involved in cell wall biosynthesis